jgi:hypothetical protein
MTNQHQVHVEQPAIKRTLTEGLRVSKATKAAASVAVTCGKRGHAGTDFRVPLAKAE